MLVKSSRAKPGHIKSHQVESTSPFSPETEQTDVKMQSADTCRGHGHGPGCVPYTSHTPGRPSQVLLTTPPTPPLLAQKKKSGRERQPPNTHTAASCTRERWEFGHAVCSDELGEPEVGHQLGLVDVNAVPLRIYCYSLLSP